MASCAEADSAGGGSGTTASLLGVVLIVVPPMLTKTNKDDDATKVTMPTTPPPVHPAWDDATHGTAMEASLVSPSVQLSPHQKEQQAALHSTRDVKRYIVAGTQNGKCGQLRRSLDVFVHSIHILMYTLPRFIFCFISGSSRGRQEWSSQSTSTACMGRQ